MLELKPKEKDFGFLSLNRAIALDRLLTFLVQTLSVLCLFLLDCLNSSSGKKLLLSWSCGRRGRSGLGSGLRVYQVFFWLFCLVSVDSLELATGQISAFTNLQTG